MGFYLRKSVSVGPFRFNLSGSGVGMSVGVRGLRVGTGPRGNYVRIGRGGVYYQETFRTSQPAPPAAPQLPSTSASQIADSSSERLLNDIREKQHLFAFTPLVIALSMILLFFAAASGSVSIAFPALILAIAAISYAKYRDTMRKTVVVLYDLDAHADEAFQRFHEWAQTLASTQRAWLVSASTQRQPARLRTSTPPRLRTNVPVLSICAGARTFYFLPDHLLVYDANGVGAVSYRTLDLSVSRQQCIEYGGAPSDAAVVGYTWRHARRDGGPDRRFNVNPQLPICSYDALHFRTTSGLNDVVQLSRAGVAEGFAAAVRHLGNVVS